MVVGAGTKSSLLPQWAPPRQTLAYNILVPFVQVVPRGDNVACCGGQSYSTLHQVCCGNTLSDIHSGRTECCGDTTFNPATEHCCAAVVFPIGELFVFQNTVLQQGKEGRMDKVGSGDRKEVSYLHK